MGWRTRGLKGQEAGRQVSRMQSGERGERVAGKKKKLSLILPQSTPFKKIHLDLLKTKPKRKTKSPRCKIYIYTPGRYIYV